MQTASLNSQSVNTSTIDFNKLKKTYNTLPEITLPYGDDSDYYENDTPIEFSPMPSEFHSLFNQTNDEALGEVSWAKIINPNQMIFIVQGWEEWGDQRIDLFIISEDNQEVNQLLLSSARDEVITSTEQLASHNEGEEIEQEIGCRSTAFFIDNDYNIIITERISAVGYSDVTGVSNYKITKEGKIEFVTNQ